MLKKICNLFIKNLYEDRYNCILCGDEYPHSDRGLCKQCVDKIALNDGPICSKCGTGILGGDGFTSVCGNCSGKIRNFDAGIVALLYQDDVKKLILKYKFYNAAYLGKYLVKFLQDAVLKSKAVFDVIAYVPLARKKLKQRGYDQAEILAKELSVALAVPLFNGLKRRPNTLEQHDLSHQERQKNAEKLFYCEGEKEKVKGKTVLLVDDIITTGATCDAAALTLKKLGAEKVIIAALAGAQYKVKFEKESPE